jgi:hypothetical protein
MKSIYDLTRNCAIVGLQRGVDFNLPDGKMPMTSVYADSHCAPVQPLNNSDLELN